MILVSLNFWIGTAFGIIVGAVGKYLADKWTDKRRKKESVSETDQAFRSVYSQMPKLIHEMRTDVQRDPLVREFILCRKRGIYGHDPNHQIFTYFYEEHDSLESAVRILEANEFVDDIAFNDVKRFQMTEGFVLLLRKSRP